MSQLRVPDTDAERPSTPRGRRSSGRARSKSPHHSASSTGKLEDEILCDPKDEPESFRRSERRRTWHTRPKSPGIKWYKKYTGKTVKRGRVLVIDYVKQEQSKEGMRKVSTLEVNDIGMLRRLYDHPNKDAQPILRLMHVQNAEWAVDFIVKKFYIQKGDLVGSDFGRYVSYTRPQRRGGKPLLKGRAWPTTHDPWRGISRTAFGVDYLKPYRVVDPTSQNPAEVSDKFLEMNSYDESNDSPMYGYDIFAQRISCYIQRKEQVSEVPNDLDFQNPYENATGTKRRPSQYHPILESLDNENVIIIFENSKSGSIEDTLIAAREKWEARWRRLPFYLAYEAKSIEDDDQMTAQSMKMIIQDVWKSIAHSWSVLLEVADSHVEILENKIYEFPADESRADEIWLNSSAWLRIERLIYRHIDTLTEVRGFLGELTDETENDWLENAPDELERIKHRIQEDLIKPTDSLSDLMYKSVEIRDSRHSLELSLSMWRLSWLSFVFLPLTFIVGFFGMNVDIFADPMPPIKWYFISAIPLMILVLISWFMLKHTIAKSRQTPYSRGIYERLFHDLATAYPKVWSRNGPYGNVVPHHRIQRIQWWLIRRWNAVERTTRNPAAVEYDQFDGLSSWSRFKRLLTRKWTKEINFENEIHYKKTIEEGEGDSIVEAIEEVNQMLHIPAHGITDPGMLRVPHSLNQRVSMDANGAITFPERPESQGSSGGRNSGIIIEEQRPEYFGPLKST